MRRRQRRAVGGRGGCLAEADAAHVGVQMTSAKVHADHRSGRCAGTVESNLSDMLGRNSGQKRHQLVDGNRVSSRSLPSKFSCNLLELQCWKCEAMDDTLALTRRAVGHSLAGEPPEVKLWQAMLRQRPDGLLSGGKQRKIEFELHDEPPKCAACDGRRRRRTRDATAREAKRDKQGRNSTSAIAGLPGRLSRRDVDPGSTKWPDLTVCRRRAQRQIRRRRGLSSQS